MVNGLKDDLGSHFYFGKGIIGDYLLDVFYFTSICFVTAHFLHFARSLPHISNISAALIFGQLGVINVRKSRGCANQAQELYLQRKELSELPIFLRTEAHLLRLVWGRRKK